MRVYKILLLIKEYCMTTALLYSPNTRSTDKGDVTVWHDGGLVLACDRISSMVTYMKVKRDGVFGRDLLIDLVAAFCFTLVLYIPVRVPLSSNIYQTK